MTEPGAPPGRKARSRHFVRRDQIIGRALLVFWPLKVSWGVYRLKWIR